jgi:hypothetical protein
MDAGVNWGSAKIKTAPEFYVNIYLREANPNEWVKSAI